MKLLSDDELLNLLRQRCQQAGSVKAWAEQHGVSATYVSDVLGKRRQIGLSVYGALGYERVTLYQEIAAGNPKAQPTN